MQWDIEHTGTFEAWWDTLAEAETESVRASVLLLRHYGPHLRFPHSSGIHGSRHGNMRELRIQQGGRPLRVLYAFDPRRCAILLLGGEKTGDDRWYRKHVPIADRLYDDHLKTLETRIDRWPGSFPNSKRRCRPPRASGRTRSIGDWLPKCL